MKLSPTQERVICSYKAPLGFIETERVVRISTLRTLESWGFVELWSDLTWHGDAQEPSVETAC